VLERALQDVGDDLHVAVGVGVEAPAGLDAVFVDHPQVAEAHVARVLVAGEREGVEALEPAVPGVAALPAPAHREHAATLPVGPARVERPSRR
jgi:CTP:molybdopterin cytidylyltransferase MocA